MIQQAAEPFLRRAGLGGAEVFHFLEREQGVSGFDDPVAQGQMTLRLPGKAGFDFFQDGCNGRRELAFEKVADKNRMQDNLARARGIGA